MQLASAAAAAAAAAVEAAASVVTAGKIGKATTQLPQLLQQLCTALMRMRCLPSNDASANLLRGGALLQDVAKGLHVGVNAMHHFSLLPQVALHCHIDVIVPAMAYTHESSFSIIDSKLHACA